MDPHQPSSKLPISLLVAKTPLFSIKQRHSLGLDYLTYRHWETFSQGKRRKHSQGYMDLTGVALSVKYPGSTHVCAVLAQLLLSQARPHSLMGLQLRLLRRPHPSHRHG